MKPVKSAILAASLFFTLALLAQTKEQSTLPDGKALAAEICAMGPIKDSDMSGTLYIKRKSTEKSVPIQIKLVKKGEDSWQSIYQTKSSKGTENILLIIQQTPGKPNSYELTTATNQSPEKLTGKDADKAFAGSDFWLSDLGLEFFRWTEQQVIKQEKMRGQLCYVLESKNLDEKGSTYSKVISWIDQETLGIMQAEAYDASGKILKRFIPKTFQKVNGQYQVKNVEIFNLQSSSSTRLEFDLSGDK